MYRSIWNSNDSVTCVYTSHSLYCSTTENNPIFRLSMFGSFNGIITEHVYPRSKGAENGNALSDMHHLVPARLGANIARNNFPFDEIPDAETSLWLYKTENSTSIPSANIDLYSEQRIGRFEPREDFKGNVARAVFYFFTMYNAEALAADPDFFEEQREHLCQWHYLDPVDEQEYNRTFDIAQYQDDRPNPFVMDCTLPFRTYCSDFALACTPVSSGADPIRPDLQLSVFPNPSSGSTTIRFSLEQAETIRLEVYDLLGRELMRVAEGRHQPGQYEYHLPLSERLDAGMVICRLVVANGDHPVVLQEKVLIR